MPPRSGQNLATWLMFIPLLVVPAVAIFGVPQFSRLSSKAESAPVEEPELTLGTSDASPFGKDFAPLPTDRVEGSKRPDPFSPGSSFQTTDDPFRNPDALKTFNTEPGDAPKFSDAPRFGETPEATPAPSDPQGDPFAVKTDAPAFNPGHPPSTNPEAELGAPKEYQRPANRTRTPVEVKEPTPEEQLSWRQAVARLNALGVSQYSLEPSPEPYLFRFTCDFTPEDNPRLTHRFEAEASEPLRAVQKAIAQVETWIAQRDKP